MNRSAAQKVTLAALVGAVALTSSAWVPASSESAPAVASSAATCQFIVKASNKHSFDVFIDFYDSTVRGTGTFAKNKPLMYKGGRVQDRRIPRGQSMEQRIEADGGCEKTRHWQFAYRIGSRSQSQVTNRSTSTSKQRTIDLGPSNTWDD